VLAYERVVRNQSSVITAVNYPAFSTHRRILLPLLLVLTVMLPQATPEHSEQTPQKVQDLMPFKQRQHCTRSTLQCKGCGSVGDEEGG